MERRIVSTRNGKERRWRSLNLSSGGLARVQGENLLYIESGSMPRFMEYRQPSKDTKSSTVNFGEMLETPRTASVMCSSQAEQCFPNRALGRRGSHLSRLHIDD